VNECPLTMLSDSEWSAVFTLLMTMQLTGVWWWKHSWNEINYDECPAVRFWGV